MGGLGWWGVGWVAKGGEGGEGGKEGGKRGGRVKKGVQEVPKALSLRTDTE